jgi:hypothetical protein
MIFRVSVSGVPDGALHIPPFGSDLSEDEARVLAEID